MGSIPTPGTSLRSLRELRLGKPAFDRWTGSFGAAGGFPPPGINEFGGSSLRDITQQGKQQGHSHVVVVFRDAHEYFWSLNSKVLTRKNQMRERIGAHSQRIVVVDVGLFLLPVAPGWAREVGQPFPPWSPGMLDIHQIDTGRGNSAFLLFPDGTTLLVDAGAVGQSRWDLLATKPEGPNGGERIARYAKHMLAHDAGPSLDYALPTHFHDVHTAFARRAAPRPVGA